MLIPPKYRKGSVFTGLTFKLTWMVSSVDQLLGLQRSLEDVLGRLKVSSQPSDPPELGLSDGGADVPRAVDVLVDLHRGLQ